jgi:hypothetical protein
MTGPCISSALFGSCLRNVGVGSIFSDRLECPSFVTTMTHLLFSQSRPLSVTMVRKPKRESMPAFVSTRKPWLINIRPNSFHQNSLRARPDANRGCLEGAAEPLRFFAWHLD